jgi:hypothetical protein
MTGTAYNLCGGGNYTYAIPAVSGATSYSWTVPSGCTIVTNNGNSIVLSIPANFVSGSVCVTAFNNCGGSVSTCRSIYARPDVPAAITGLTSVCPSQTNLSYSTTLVSGLTYNWTVPAGATINSGQGTNAVNTNWGTTVGSVTVTASNPCASSLARSLSVSLAACTQSGEGEGMALISDEQAELLIYPNPNDGQFFVKSNSAGTFVLMNNLGQVMQVFSLNDENGMIRELNHLSTGLYFIQGNTEKGVVNSKIIVGNK